MTYQPAVLQAQQTLVFHGHDERRTVGQETKARWFAGNFDDSLDPTVRTDGEDLASETVRHPEPAVAPPGPFEKFETVGQHFCLQGVFPRQFLDNPPITEEPYYRSATKGTASLRGLPTA